MALTIGTKNGDKSFSGAASAMATLAPLPPELEFLDVQTRAGAYKEYLRSFKIAPDRPDANNAYEALAPLFGNPGDRPCDWKITADDVPDGVINPMMLPWELILFGGDDDLLKRVSVVRSLNRSGDYAPSVLSDPMRTLVVQGGQLETGTLAYDRETRAFNTAWDGLGTGSKSRIAQPVIKRFALGDLAAGVAHVRPHLLCFSGHGRATPAGFEFLFDRTEGWVNITVIAELLSNAPALPKFVAFWTCEGLRIVGGEGGEITDRGGMGQHLPSLVQAMSGLGIEAVIGCQTRIEDSCSRVLARTLFRSMAEGQGPARALATARAELASAPQNASPAAEALWPSPVLWIGGASIPRLIWARPTGEDLAVLIDKISYESISRTEEAAAVWAAAPSDPAVGFTWFGERPCWVVHTSLRDDRVEVFAALRQASQAIGRSLLILTVFNDQSHNFLAAFAENMRDLKARIFPGALLSETAWLMSIFALAEQENRREEAWRQLTHRQDLSIAIVARGGLSDVQTLTATATTGQTAPLVVISPSSINAVVDAQGVWRIDGFSPQAALAPRGHEAFLRVLAVFNQTLSKYQIDDFGKRLHIADAFDAVKPALVSVGRRYAISAALASKLQDALKPDERREAHRQCMAYLKASAIDPTRPVAVQRDWLFEHALGADSSADVIPRASDAIAAWAAERRIGRVVAIYAALKSRRNQLPFARLLDVARAHMALGRPDLAENIMVKITPHHLSPSDQVQLALCRAEALRNTSDQENRATALSLLAEALPTAEADASHHDDPWRALQVLIVRHDIARHGVYFHQESAVAKAEYTEIIKVCGENPERQYLKAAALRNLADVCCRYAFDLPADPQAAMEHLEEAKGIADDYNTVRGLLPEISYELSKSYCRVGRDDEAETMLTNAISIARSEGNALITALALNRRFWKEAAPALSDSAYETWLVIEEQLDVVQNHPWAARALVNAWLRVAKRMLGARRKDAIDKLEAASDILLRSDGLSSPSDIRERWLPALAGLMAVDDGNGGGVFRGKLTEKLADLGTDVKSVDWDRVWSGVL
ncbi:CHAT domain-containing protein [Rhizobium leguminosarum]|uniref:CHAT domain-containing protein n=1 Tax=Rhizobium leguminosarum TaxID=384 RepID=UPI001C94532B|nr:CHAT domain-containing protein [Rhizobium leguminosarum]MBY5731500.1 CHAT domain-containing protein [Rhizobium leguminosarum]